MGQRDFLSFLDIKTANDLYKCAGKFILCSHYNIFLFSSKSIINLLFKKSVGRKKNKIIIIIKIK